MSPNLAACSPVTRLPFLLPLLPVMFQFPGISSTPLGKTCISTSQRVSALWNPTPRLLFLLGTIPPSPATDSSLKPQESNPSPRPTYTASAAGPLPTVPCPLPRASPCPLTGVGLQQHFCLSQDLLGPVLGAVRPGQEGRLPPQTAGTPAVRPGRAETPSRWDSGDSTQAAQGGLPI